MFIMQYIHFLSRSNSCKTKTKKSSRQFGENLCLSVMKPWILVPDLKGLKSSIIENAYHITKDERFLTERAGRSRTAADQIMFPKLADKKIRCRDCLREITGVGYKKAHRKTTSVNSRWEH